MRTRRTRKFLYCRPYDLPRGSGYKYYTLLQRLYGGEVDLSRNERSLRKRLAADQPELAFVLGDLQPLYRAPLELGIPYILVENDVCTLRFDANAPETLSEAERAACEREREMIENAHGVLLVSEFLVPYLRKRYRLPRHEVVHLRPLREDIQFPACREKLAGKHLVYAGGCVGWERRGTPYGYRAYHAIFRVFMDAGWTVHLYSTNAFPQELAEYSRLGVVVHKRRPYVELLREMGQYTAGLQGFNVDGVPARALAYTQRHCAPNKCFDYLAAMIPTIGVNPGRASDFYTSGGWGVVLEEMSVDAVRRVESMLPVITDEMRQAQVMERDIPKLRRLVSGATAAIKRRSRRLVAGYRVIKPQEGHMVIRVKPTLAIPRTVKVGFEQFVTFNPDAEVPDAVGNRLLKAQPQLYEIAEGKPDLSKYKRRDQGAPGTPTNRPGLVLTDEETAVVLAARAAREKAGFEPPSSGEKELTADEKKAAAHKAADEKKAAARKAADEKKAAA